MKKLSGMVDMSMSDKEKEEMMSPSPPKYPYGLCISLCEEELKKLGIAEDELEVGDMLHLHSLAKVTSVSSHDNEFSSGCRIELQICYMSGENEEDENKPVTSRLYKK